MDDIQKILADRLRHYRKAKGWTQPDLAEACDPQMSVSYIANLEAPRDRKDGRRAPWVSPEAAHALAKALDIPVAKLFEDSEPEPLKIPQDLLYALTHCSPEHLAAVRAILRVTSARPASRVAESEQKLRKKGHHG